MEEDYNKIEKFKHSTQGMQDVISNAFYILVL